MTMLNTIKNAVLAVAIGSSAVSAEERISKDASPLAPSLNQSSGVEGIEPLLVNGELVLDIDSIDFKDVQSNKSAELEKPAIDLEALGMPTRTYGAEITGDLNIDNIDLPIEENQSTQQANQSITIDQETLDKIFSEKRNKEIGRSVFSEEGNNNILDLIDGK